MINNLSSVKKKNGLIKILYNVKIHHFAFKSLHLLLSDFKQTIYCCMFDIFQKLKLSHKITYFLFVRELDFL